MVKWSSPEGTAEKDSIENALWKPYKRFHDTDSAFESTRERLQPLEKIFRRSNLRTNSRAKKLPPPLMQATLPSNSGEDCFLIDLIAPAEYTTCPGFESSLQIRGRHWDGDHTFPFSISAAGLWLGSANLTNLREHIIQWSHQPLPQLVSEDLDGEFELASLPGQSIQIRFGSRSDTISYLNPVVSISFSVGALRGEFHFVTDQSCLALFAQDLTSALSDSA